LTTLTPVELAIMKSLWGRRTARVRDVQADLMPHRKLAYTTVMTVLDRLFRKGVVRRTKRSRAHVYEPAFSEAALRSDAVRGLLDDYFGGSSRALREFLDGGQEVGAPPRTPRVHEQVGTMDESLL
jgi:predicted transcriptional regulator